MTANQFRRTLLMLLAGFVLAAPLNAFAQGGPDKPILIMVGASPGGGTDILARMLADKFAPS